jgi:hypothetical protein
MNHTGVHGTGSRRQARIKGELLWGWITVRSYWQLGRVDQVAMEVHPDWVTPRA